MLSKKIKLLKNCECGMTFVEKKKNYVNKKWFLIGPCSNDGPHRRGAALVSKCGVHALAGCSWSRPQPHGPLVAQIYEIQ